MKREKKEGIALATVLMTAALISLLVLLSYSELTSSNKELKTTLIKRRDEYERKAGIEILKHETSKILKVSNRRGFYFMKGSKYLHDQPSQIDLNIVNYDLKRDGTGKVIGALPKPGMYYSGVLIRSFYDYIGKALVQTYAGDKYAWKATEFYFNRSTGEDSTTPKPNFVNMRWVGRREGANEVDLLKPLLKIKSSDPIKDISIGGYRILDVKIFSGNLASTIHKRISLDEFQRLTGLNYNGVVEVRFLKKVKVSKLDGTDGENYSIIMSLRGLLSNGDFIKEEVVENRNIYRASKIIKE